MPKEPTGFEQMYPNITEWVKSYGWIEIGDDQHNTSCLRALHEGGLVWKDNYNDWTLDEAFKVLDSFLAEQMSQYG